MSITEKEVEACRHNPTLAMINRAILADLALEALRARGQEQWRIGEPPYPFKSEWFIAETTFGDRVVLRALPGDLSDDYKVADYTYVRADKIKRWMPFPDCEFAAPPAQPGMVPPVAAPDAVNAGLVRRLLRQAAHVKDNANRLKAFKGQADEARCRELAALFLEEIAHTVRLDEELAALRGGKGGG